MALIHCPECGKEISDKAENCPNCGYALQRKVYTSSFPINKAISFLLTIAIIGGVFFAIVSQMNSLSGKDKQVYNITIKCADEYFKDPSSLRLVSGSLSSSGKLLYCKARAKNSFGAYVSNYYEFYLDGYVREISDSQTISNLYTSSSDFNIEKVNAAIEKHYK